MIMLSICCAAVALSSVYEVDVRNTSRRFDGIGALSAGGTSRLLYDYAEPHRSTMLDLLFSPTGGGAALHILKVEIGGDTEAGCGSEPSHMRSESEVPNLVRGYEAWLLAEARKRAPAIKTWGLSWGFPTWIGLPLSLRPANDTYKDNAWAMANPTTIARIAHYTQQWAKGLSVAPFNVQLDWVGIWNENSWSPAYIKALRAALDADAATESIAIVAPDSGSIPNLESVLAAMEADPAVAAALTTPPGALGIHYPLASASSSALLSNKFSLPAWSSEDSSTNDQASPGEGPGCWARVLNWNYVVGRYTSTTMWSLLSAWFEDLHWFGDGLFSAGEPWSGHYSDLETMFVTAHWTQFTQPGWTYLAHGAGVGWLEGGGTYSTLVRRSDASATAAAAVDAVTVVLETMRMNHSQCIRSNPTAPWNVNATQIVTLQLAGVARAALAQQQQPLREKGEASAPVKLAVWRSVLYNGKTGAPNNASHFMLREDDIAVSPRGTVTLTVAADSVVTLTSLLATGSKAVLAPPPSAPFPLPLRDAFDAADAIDRAPRFFADMIGSFALARSSSAAAGSSRAEQGGGVVLQQQVIGSPSVAGVGWHNQDSIGAVSLVGSYVQTDHDVSVTARSTGDDPTAELAGVDPRYVALGARLGGELLTTGCEGGHGLGPSGPLFPREQNCVQAYADTWYDFGYYLVASDSKNEWALLAGQRTLARGALASGRHPGTWHALRLAARATRITAWVDGALVANLSDATFARGWAAVGSGFHTAEFANFSLSEGRDVLRVP
jgi:galactosylceramidase